MSIPKDENLKEIQDILSNKKQTNFERITESVQTMAEFLANDAEEFEYCRPKYCKYYCENGDCEAYKNGKKDGCLLAAKTWLESEA